MIILCSSFFGSSLRNVGDARTVRERERERERESENVSQKSFLSVCSEALFYTLDLFSVPKVLLVVFKANFFTVNFFCTRTHAVIRGYSVPCEGASAPSLCVCVNNNDNDDEVDYK